MKTLPVALTIAGSDSSAGAGIQADLKTFAALGVYGTSAITAITAQNTCSVRQVVPMTPEMVHEQIDAIFADMHISAIKVGMLPNPAIALGLVEALERRPNVPLILDPVLVSTSGDALATSHVAPLLKDKVAHIATLVTPNIEEAEVLSGVSIKSKADLKEAAKVMRGLFNTNVLVKGGHLEDAILVDVLATKDALYELENIRINTKHTHGTGCTLSSAIAAFIARGYSLLDAVEAAHHYVHGAIENAPHLGRGHGPLHHFYRYYSRAGLDDVRAQTPVVDDETDANLMMACVELAKLSHLSGDVPVGAVVVKDGRIIGRGFNTRERDNDPMGHAELNAIKEASDHLKSWRLKGCTLYVTLEPCHMCSGAITNARLERLVFGAYDKKAGGVRSISRLCDDTRMNHRLPVVGGVNQEVCEKQLTDFFKKVRRD